MLALLAVAFFDPSSCIHASYLKLAKLVLCFKSNTERDSVAPKDLELEQRLTGGKMPLDAHLPHSQAAAAGTLIRPKHAKEPDGPPPAAPEKAANTPVE